MASAVKQHMEMMLKSSTCVLVEPVWHSQIVLKSRNIFLNGSVTLMVSVAFSDLEHIALSIYHLCLSSLSIISSSYLQWSGRGTQSVLASPQGGLVSSLFQFVKEVGKNNIYQSCVGAVISMHHLTVGTKFIMDWIISKSLD